MNGHSDTTAPMMTAGYSVRDSVRIRFPEGSPYHGAVVDCRAVLSVTKAMEWDHILDDRRAAIEGGESNPATLYVAIGEFIRMTPMRWNLREPHPAPDGQDAYDEDGVPIPWAVDEAGDVIQYPMPLTEEAFDRLPLPFVVELMNLYRAEVWGVPVPLGGTSPAGSSSEAQPPDQTEPPSRSRGNSRRRK